MANLEFCDTHNMVAYLHKIEGSEGFHPIVDFLNTSHIKYAVTENPTIHVLLIQEFWQTTAANTIDSREVQITATIDGKVKLISEASIRRHLKLTSEYLGSIIDSGLSEVVLGQPFAHTSKLAYDESLGLIRFAQRDDEVVFRMPQRTKELDLVSSLEKDKFEALFVENLKLRHVLEKRKGYYKACMNL
ncbi:hypothetical protein Tco_0941282 [Tanacetum coccineum]|uniref:Uncharacterized protein n=1 Tax=Tanacetum coccineum TaxID=301880 RepID=A0ABQ5DST4_9ASTR